MSATITDAVVIPKGYLAFDSLAFVTGAISKEEDRFVLHHIEITRRDLITVFAATDGRRLHLAQLDPGLFDDDIDVLDPGLYLLIAKSAKFIVLRKTTDTKLTYPDWRSLTGDYELGDNLAEVCSIADSGKIGEVMIRTGKLLDTAFLAAAMGYGSSRKPNSAVHLNFEVGNTEAAPVFLAHDHGTALVMPLRRTKEDSADGENEYETTPIAAFNPPDATPDDNEPELPENCK